jgi:hypothetical protein
MSAMLAETHPATAELLDDAVMRNLASLAGESYVGNKRESIFLTGFYGRCFAMEKNPIFSSVCRVRQLHSANDRIGEA